MSVFHGMVVLTTVLFVLAISLHRGQSDATARALTFATLVFGVLSLITVNRSWSRNLIEILRSPNAAYRWVMLGTMVFLAAILYLPFLRSVFRFALLSSSQLGFATAAGAAIFILLVAIKRDAGHR